MNTTRIFLCHDLDINDGARMDVRILQKIRQKFQEAQVEVVLYPGPITDAAFLAFVRQELPTCQWFLLFQALSTPQSFPVHKAVEIARELHAQQGIKGLLRFMASPEQAPEVPSTWADILFFGTTPDYRADLEQLLALCTLPEDDPDTTHIKSRAPSLPLPEPAAGPTPFSPPPTDLQKIAPTPETPSELIMLAYNTAPQPANDAAPSLPVVPSVFAYVPFNSPHPLPAGNATLAPMPPDYDRPLAPLPVVARRAPKVSHPKESVTTERPLWPFRNQNSTYERATTARPRFQRILFTTLLIVFCVALALFINDAWLFHTLRPSDSQATSSTQAKTEVVQTTPGSTPNPYTDTGSLIADDPLQHPGLVTGYSDNSGYCGFQGNALHVVATASYYDFGCGESIDVSNFVLEVQATVLKGSCAGIAFRLINAGNWPYQLYICRYSSYTFGRYDINAQGNWVPHILKQGIQPLIKPDLGATNTIGLVANGSTFTLYVNYHAITTITDATYKNAGPITLVAQSVASPTEATFTDLKIWQL